MCKRCADEVLVRRQAAVDKYISGRGARGPSALSLDELEADVEQIWKNCRIYNPKSSRVFKLGEQAAAQWRSECAALALSGDAGRRRPKKRMAYGDSGSGSDGGGDGGGGDSEYGGSD
ncbi:hypothetical protein GPECTOR_74g703 [Gonium pectorale]|uniref:Bromo domain-containing protein n=1 Tax=Gonium pectorale TaxID=33097 RepID=A0A150G2I7_GONPE|nr:hypothetical protein GPECTOR_74g703 [Gonium pectorale]|eukprot:KXZ44089.1 hypothetical protein GPECTOR_74g703 [Gonium pectorale]